MMGAARPHKARYRNASIAKDFPSGMNALVEGDVASATSADKLDNVTVRTGRVNLRPGQQLANTAAFGSGTVQGVGRVKLNGNKRTLAIRGGNVGYDSGSNTWVTTNMPSVMDSSVTRILIQQVGDYALFLDGITDPQVTDGTAAKVLTPVRKPYSVLVERSWQFGVEAWNFNLFDNYGASQDQQRVYNDAAYVLQFTDNGGSVQLARVGNDNTVTVTQTGSPSDPTANFVKGGEIRFVGSGGSFVATIEASSWNAGAKTLTITLAEPAATVGLGIGATGDKLYTQGVVPFELATGTAPNNGGHQATKLTIKAATSWSAWSSLISSHVYAEWLVLSGHSATYPLAYDMRSFAILVNNTAPFSSRQLKLGMRTGTAANQFSGFFTSQVFRIVKDNVDSDWSWVVFDFTPEILGASGQYISSILLMGVDGAVPPAADTDVQVAKFAALGSAPPNVGFRVTQKRHVGYPFVMESPPYVVDVAAITTPAGSYPQDDGAGVIWKITVSDPGDSTITEADVYRQVGDALYLLSTTGTFSGSSDLVVYDDARLITSTVQPPSVYAASCPRAKAISEYRTRLALLNVQEFNYSASPVKSGFTASGDLSSPHAVLGSGGSVTYGTFDTTASSIANGRVLGVNWSNLLDVDVTMTLEGSNTSSSGPWTSIGSYTLTKGDHYYPQAFTSGYRYIRVGLRAVDVTAPAFTAYCTLDGLVLPAAYTARPLEIWFSMPRAENNARLQFSTEYIEDAQYEPRDLGFRLALPSDAGSEGRALAEVGEFGASSLFAFTDRRVYRVYGTDARDMRTTLVDAENGCQAPASVVSFRNAVWYLGSDNYVRRIGVDGGIEAVPVGAPVQPTIAAAAAADRRAAHAFIVDHYYVLIYDAAHGLGVVYDMVRQVWTSLSSWAASCAVRCTLASDDNEVYGVSSTGYLRRLWYGSQDQADQSAGGGQVNITGTVQTHWLNFGSNAEKRLRRLVATGDHGLTFSVAIEPEWRSALAAVSIALTTSGVYQKDAFCSIQARGKALRFSVTWAGTTGQGFREIEAELAIWGRATRNRT